MVARLRPWAVRVRRQVWIPRVVACAATHRVKTSRSTAGVTAGVPGERREGVKQRLLGSVAPGIEGRAGDARCATEGGDDAVFPGVGEEVAGRSASVGLAC